MNLFTELLSYIIIIIIGIILVNWYGMKKGWEKQFSKSLLFILCWRTAILFIIIITNILLEILLQGFLLTYYYYIFYPIIFVGVSFFINILLGVAFFKLVYRKTAQDSLVFVLIIVIIEIIIESVLFYTVLVLQSIISNFNL